MAINPSRQQTRLDKTKAEAASITSEIQQTEARLRLAGQHIDDFQAQVVSLDKRIAAQAAVQVELAGKPDKSEDDLAQLRASIETLSKLAEEKGTVVQTLEAEVQTLRDLTPRLEALNRHPIFATLALQQAALDRAEEAYPSLLKRHLRKCKRFGWSDGRLAALKGGK
jgi:chromosome segregation ATPase